MKSSHPLLRTLPWALLVAAMAFPILAAVMGSRGAAPGEALADLGRVAEFQMTERSGAAISRGDLLGQPWFASFIFTRCEGPCPAITRKMARLQDELLKAGNGEVRLVSISVDPSHDTPERLRAYADENGADPDRWLFLTGDPAATQALVRGSFHLPADRNPEAPVGRSVTHAARIALVDAGGQIRRYYRSGDTDWIEQALADLERLP